MKASILTILVPSFAVFSSYSMFSEENVFLVFWKIFNILKATTEAADFTSALHKISATLMCLTDSKIHAFHF